MRLLQHQRSFKVLQCFFFSVFSICVQSALSRSPVTHLSCNRLSLAFVFSSFCLIQFYIIIIDIPYISGFEVVKLFNYLDASCEISNRLLFYYSKYLLYISTVYSRYLDICVFRLYMYIFMHYIFFIISLIFNLDLHCYLFKSGRRQSCFQNASFVCVVSVYVGEERSTAAVLHRPRVPHCDSISVL